MGSGDEEGRCEHRFKDEEYRQINYENYKKKAVKMLSALKYLYFLYTERIAVKKGEEVLETMMQKMVKGGSNMIIELVRHFDEIPHAMDGVCEFDLDDLIV